MKTTYFYNQEGQVIKTHSGEPRKIETFKKNAEHAIRIDICEFVAYHYFARHFFKVDGRWVGEIFKTAEGWKRHVLVEKKTLMHLDTESVTQEEVDAILAEESTRVLQDARESIFWCDPKDAEDEDGRYWISAYSGAGVYRLIVQHGKIVGAINGGLHGSRRVICSDDAWVMALRKAIAERVEGEYQLLKADGSGTYFYLRDAEDAQYINTERYHVPSINGGQHLNIEIK